MVVFGQLFGLVVLMMRDWMHAWMGLPRRIQEIITVLSIMMTHVLGCTLVRPHCDQGRTKLSTTGTGCAFSQQESVRVHDETWAGGNESLRLTISQAKEILRMDAAQLSGHKLVRGIGHCLPGCGGPSHS